MTKPQVDPIHPAVQPSPSVAPAFLPRRECLQYCATPNERSHHAASKRRHKSKPIRRKSGAGLRSLKVKSRFRIECAYTVEVVELIYPGTEQDVAPVEGKWVYVFRDQKLVTEALATRAGVWSGTTIEQGKRHPWRSDSGVRIDPGPRSSPHTYYFLLSPVQLTQTAIDGLESGSVLETAAVECLGDQFGKTVYVPDPLRWAADAHEMYYLPRAETLNHWRFDPQLVACRLVAHTVKAWISDGDEADVKDELLRDPEEWLKLWEDGLSVAQREAEEAHAYVAQCVESPDYRAVELSGRERLDEDLEVCAVAMAAWTRALLVTNVGKELAARLAADPERLPKYFIFNEEQSKLGDDYFGRYRYTYKAFLSLFNEILPAVAQATNEEGASLRQVESQRVRIQRYLEKLSIATTLRKPQAQLLENLKKGNPISAGTTRRSREWRKIQNEWQRLCQTEPIRKGTANTHEVVSSPISKRLAPFAPMLKVLNWTATSAVEITNFVIAYKALRAAAPSERLDRVVSLIGASSDLLEHASGLAEEFVREEMKRGAKAAAGAFGLISGVIDMLEYGRQLEKAEAEHDYGEAVGHGIQVVGAAAAAVGSGLALSEAIGGALVKPKVPGGWITFIGTVLVAAGFWVVAWLKRNVSEVFASRCFLGKLHGMQGGSVDWSHTTLPTQDPVEEASALIDLLAQFRISTFCGFSDGAGIRIDPGYLEDAWRMDVLIRSWWLVNEERSYVLEVDLDDDEIRQLSGPPLKRLSTIHRESDGQGPVGWISINLAEAAQVEQWFRQIKTTIQVRLRLVGTGRVVPTDPSRAVQINFLPDQNASSMDPSSWQESELPKEYRQQLQKG